MNKDTLLRLKPFVYAFLILLIAAGVLFYLASYFTGLLLILAGCGLLAWYQAAIEGRSHFRMTAKRWIKQLAVPLTGILLAVLIGAVVMLATGYNPLSAYAALFYGGFVKNWHVALLNATPLIFTGLSVAFAFKAGLFNIGAEGQYYVGAMTAALLGISLQLPGFISVPLIMLLAGLAALAYNAIPAFLKIKTGAHEVLTTMMFAHIARYFTSVFIRLTGGDPSYSTHPYVTDPVLPGNWLPVFKSLLPAANYRLHIGILIAVFTALFVYFLLYRTRWGFMLRAVGQNPHAARTQGIPVKRVMLFGLLFAGFLAGLAGAVQVLGLDHKLFENLDAGYGWNGISVALLAYNHPIGVIFIAILWGSLDAGGQYMYRVLQIPNSIVEIIKGMMLFLVVSRYLYSWAAVKFKPFFTRIFRKKEPDKT